MFKWLGIIVATLRSVLRPQRQLALENLVLRQQLAVLKHRYHRPRLSDADRLFWVFLSRLWSGWRGFLENHAKELVALDVFTVPSATFKVLFVLVILSHDRRRILHFNVTEHPTAAWTARQLLGACGMDEEPRYLIRDPDAIYGEAFHQPTAALQIKDVPTARQSPWQNPYAERGIGSIRRGCLDHVIVLGERHLKRIVSTYVDYYNGTRTHLSLEKDAPEGRLSQPREQGRVVELKRVGGLHHEYVRMAA